MNESRTPIGGSVSGNNTASWIFLGCKNSKYKNQIQLVGMGEQRVKTETKRERKRRLLTSRGRTRNKTRKDGREQRAPSYQMTAPARLARFHPLPESLFLLLSRGASPEAQEIRRSRAPTGSSSTSSSPSAGTHWPWLKFERQGPVQWQMAAARANAGLAPALAVDAPTSQAPFK